MTLQVLAAAEAHAHMQYTSTDDLATDTAHNSLPVYATLQTEGSDLWQVTQVSSCHRASLSPEVIRASSWPGKNLQVCIEPCSQAHSCAVQVWHHKLPLLAAELSEALRCSLAEPT